MEFRDLARPCNLEVGFEGRPVGRQIRLLLIRVRIKKYRRSAEIEVGFVGHLGYRIMLGRCGCIRREQVRGLLR